MKNGTSENASPKRRGRPKKTAEAKNTTPHPGGGNPDFVLTPEAEAEALESFNALADQENTTVVPRGTAVGAITQEDMAIDQMLEQAAKRNPIQDLGADQPLVVEKKNKRDVLRNYVEGYKPASSIMELEDQVFQAVAHDIDSIEATDAVIRHFCKTSFEAVKKEGYFIFRNIRVYFDGFFEQNKNADSLTIEQRNHGSGSKIDTVPIIRPQRV